ncbi:MAG: hypothetical protein H6813_02510 [Phycisphaeraceae bacterium]|nr:hypothetical protein [Phycisphaeraceae bacterium]MCB9848811.1 hypothetical protein [Phycisphaeraceae bacterium]
MITMKKTLFGSAAVCAVLFTQPVLAQHDGHDHAQHAQKQAVKAWSEPYSLDTCPVSGEMLGSMGDSIVKVYDGREVRFCCKGCVKDLEADQAGFMKKIDEQIIADQLRYYPDVCVVSNEALIDDGEDIGINFVYGNRLVRFCCPPCEEDFMKDPRAYIAKIDKATADAQRDVYPLDTCPVTGKGVGSMSMGDPAEMVIAGRLIRFCCAGCEPKVKADPAKYLDKIDKAWQAKGMFMPGADMTHGEHGGMKHDDEMDHGHTKGGAHDGHGDHDH